MYSPDHGGQVRHECQAYFTGIAGYRLESLNDFGEMAMAFDAIGMEVVCRFGKQRSDRRFSASPRNTLFAIRNQHGFIDQRFALT